MAHSEEITNKMAELIQAQDLAAEANAAVKELQSELLELLAQHRRKSYSVPRGNHIFKATRVSSSRTSVNEEGLKKELGARLFNKATKRVLDKAKLEKMMDEGQVDPMIVGKHVVVKDSNPYIKISKSEINQEEKDG